MNYSFFFVIIVFFIIVLKICIFRIYPFVDQYFLIQEMDLSKRYGKGSWVLITGPSSGMGERFAHEFAKRGFNLLLMGSKKTKKVISDIKKVHANVEVRYVYADFSKSFEEGFFDSIQKEVNTLGSKWRILINNVGYRTSCIDYRNMSIEEMKKTISVGSLVQSKMTQMAMQSFSKINDYTSIVSITAQNSVCTDLFSVDNDISVPYLACYEATNAYGYFHAKSVYQEIKNNEVYKYMDFLIITPGAVLTKNTENVLKNTIFAVDAEIFVKNIIKLMGNKSGIYCAYWGHSFSGALLNIFPFVDKKSILEEIGKGFARSCENKKC